MNIACAFRALGPVTARSLQIVKAKAPTILMVNGIVCGVAATIIAVKRSPLCEQARKDFESGMEKADMCLNERVVHTNNGDIPYDEKLYKKDCLSYHARKYAGYIKAYLPVIVLGGISIASILWSHGIMMKRNLALTAALTTVSRAFKDYRKNVRDQYGNEVDYNMRHGLVVEKQKVQERDPETGKTKTVTKEVRKEKSDNHVNSSGYSRCFETGCRNWTKDPSTNRVALMSIETWANQRLRSRGYLFLNEVYDVLGLDQTLAGSEMGWIYYHNDEDNIYGDNYVDLGFSRDPKFMEGVEASVWLDFNVDDMPIRDRINWRRQ